MKDSDDWNSLRPSARKELLKKLQQCSVDLGNFTITEKQLMDMVEATDVPTVFDAILEVWSLADKTTSNNKSLLAYFTRVVKNSVKVQRAVHRKSYREPVRRKRSKGNPASVEDVLKFDPLNFKRCSMCGERLRVNSTADICTKCKNSKELLSGCEKSRFFAEKVLGDEPLLAKEIYAKAKKKFESDMDSITLVYFSVCMSQAAHDNKSKIEKVAGSHGYILSERKV